MKRVITLLLAAVMVIGAASMASAVEFKASGHMDILFGLKDNGLDTDFDKDQSEDNFYAGQRFRPKLTMNAEGVTAVFEAQQHQKWFGSDWPAGGNPDADIRIRQAYIDFKLPGTPISLKMGRQQLNLPSIWGHPVFESRVGAVLASMPLTDQISVAAFWARPADKLVNEEETIDGLGGPDLTVPAVTAAPQHNSTDMFGILLPMDFGTVKATPYFVYAKVGTAGTEVNGSGTAADPWTLGDSYSWNDTLLVGGANVNIAASDALSVKFDAIVTHHKSDGPSGLDFEMKTGWMIATAIDYEMPFGTPGFFAWYATGEDDEGEGGLAVVATDGFCPTSLGFEGYSTWDLGAWAGTSGRSTWGVGLQVADVSFIDSLKHTVRVAYINGTSDKDLDVAGVSARRPGVWESWTTKDSFIEVNLDSNWAIYENLSAAFDMGLLVPDFGSATKDLGGYEDDLAWRTQVRFRFSF